MGNSRLVSAPLLLLTALISTAVAQHQPISPAETITAESIRRHVYFLASDALEGRYTGSNGYEIAAQYGASQFRAAGLKPIGDRNGYLQRVPVIRQNSVAEPELTVTTAQVKTDFLHRRDFRWLDGEIVSCEGKPLPVVFVGLGIHEPAAGWDDFADLDVKGKVIIMARGAPMKNGAPVLPAELHEKYTSESAWQVKVGAMMLMPAAAILVPAPESFLSMWDHIPVQTDGPQTALDDRSPDAWNVATLLTVKPELLAALFAGQKQALPEADAQETSEIRGFDLEGVTFTLTTSFENEDIPTWNVVGLVEGTDPALRNEYVAVTAHLDHLFPTDEGEIMNGADDNASGCAGVMEIAGAVALRPFPRSVVFVLLAGEELMALGARYFVSTCPVPRERIIADINLDMIGRTDSASAGDRAHYALDADNIQPALKELITEVNSRTVRWPIKYVCEPDNASDNTVFELMCGIPGVFFYSGDHADRHQPTDDADKIDYEKAEGISRLCYEITRELASGSALE